MSPPMKSVSKSFLKCADGKIKAISHQGKNTTRYLILEDGGQFRERKFRIAMRKNVKYDIQFKT